MTAALKDQVQLLADQRAAHLAGLRETPSMPPPRSCARRCCAPWTPSNWTARQVSSSPRCSAGSIRRCAPSTGVAPSPPMAAPPLNHLSEDPPIHLSEEAMSEHDEQYQMYTPPDEPDWGLPQYSMSEYPQMPAPPTRRRHWLRWALAAVAVLAVIGGIGAAVGSSNPDSKPAAAKSATSSSAAPANDPANPPPLVGEDADPGYTTPTRRDFTVTLKILTKECFGSAGCNITYRPELGMNLMPADLDPSVTYDVTYRVRGGDDGAQTGTLYATGESYEGPGEELTSTDNSGVKLTAKVVSVDAEG